MLEARWVLNLQLTRALRWPFRVESRSIVAPARASRLRRLDRQTRRQARGELSVILGFVSRASFRNRKRRAELHRSQAVPKCRARPGALAPG